MSEKTEQPTPKRAKEARKKGQFAKSRLLSGALVSLAVLLALGASLPMGASRLRAFAESIFSGQLTRPADALWQGLLAVAALTLPAFAAAFATSATISTAFAGLHLELSHVAPQLERVSPASGFQRLFSLRQVVEVLKALVAALVVGAVIWSGVRDAGPSVFRLPADDGLAAFTGLTRLLWPVLVKAAFVLVLLGGADFLLARKRHRDEVMMTREEVKREHKESEGDPHHKGKRKALHRALAQGGPARGVQKATAVVVNPTHIAVALRYAEDECEAPYLVAKGQEDDALAIRKEAKRLGIPIVKDIPLARSLIHYDVGEEIPEELYRAAAAVLTVALESRAEDAGPRSRT